MNFWAYAINHPPILCRLLARHHKGLPMTDEEIAARSNLPIAFVTTLGQSMTWDGIDIPTARRFVCACGLDFCSRRQRLVKGSYIRAQALRAAKNKPTWIYLKKSPYWDTVFKPLMAKYLANVSYDTGTN